MQARARKWIVAAVACAVATLLAAPYVRTVAFLLDLSNSAPALRGFIPVGTDEVTLEDLRIPTRHGSVEARLYRPGSTDVPTVVVFPGIHGGGVEEPRLTRFCGRLAATGFLVVCTPLPDLRKYQVTPRSTDTIEDATAWVATQQNLATRGRVGLVGVSFAGGLAIVAAGRPSLSGRLDAVISIGGHGSLPRTIDYLATGLLPDGTHRAPHDYGLAVVALAAVPRLVPPAQVSALSQAIEGYLTASLDDSPSRALGMAQLADVRRQTALLAEPARSIMTALADRDVAEAGQWIAPVRSALGTDPGLSPEFSPPPSAPVFLIHGRDDNVIPSTETPLVVADLRRRSASRVTSLLTPLVSHADIQNRAGVADFWRLVSFWRAARAALGA